MLKNKTAGEKYAYFSKISLYVFIPSIIIFLASAALNTGNSTILYYITLFTLFLSAATGFETALLYVLSKIFK